MAASVSHASVLSDAWPRRANSARVRQSQPDSGLGFQEKVLTTFQAVPSSIGIGYWLLEPMASADIRILRKSVATMQTFVATTDIHIVWKSVATMRIFVATADIRIPRKSVATMRIFVANTDIRSNNVSADISSNDPIFHGWPTIWYSKVQSGSNATPNPR